MTEYYYHKYNEYLDKDTLLFWMKFYFNGRVSKTIPANEDFGPPTKESIEKGNREFIRFGDKITNIMNDKLYGYYMSVYQDIYPEENSSENINADEHYDEEFDEPEYISDDPMDYLPENPTITDVLSMHFSCDGQCYSSYALNDIFNNFNTSFMGLTEGKKTLKIYANMFVLEIFNFADAIDVSVVPSDIEWSKAAINDYFTTFKTDKLINKNGNIRTYNSSINKFYSYLKDSECILSNFFYEGDEHLHALFSLAMDDVIEIKSIDDNCIHINAENFVNNYNENQPNKSTYNQPTISKPTDDKISRLTDIEKEVISARAYLDDNSGKLRVGYKDIAEFLTNNGIYKITDNNIKQKASSIYNKLGIQDLGTAVVMLRNANGLSVYDNVKI